MTAPLEGIKVVEIASFVAVPAAGALLADLGADVVKVEVPWGELYRHSTPKMVAANWSWSWPMVITGFQLSLARASRRSALRARHRSRHRCRAARAGS